MEEPVHALKNRGNLVRLVVIWFTWKSSPIKQGAIIPEIADFSSSELKYEEINLENHQLENLQMKVDSVLFFLGSLFQQVRK